MDYSYIIIPAIVVVASQSLKLLADGIRGNFDFKNFFTFYGGFPSSHSALTASVTILVGIQEGFDSPLFGVALVFTLLIMRDAVAMRNVLGQQSILLNRYREQLSEAQRQQLPRLRERMGHSLLEVTAGAAIGVLGAWLLVLV